MPFIWALTRPYSLKTRFYLFSGSPIFKGLKKYTRMVEKNGTRNFSVLCTLKGYKKKKIENWFFYYGISFEIFLGLNLDNRTYGNSLKILIIVQKIINYWRSVLKIKTIPSLGREDHAESKYIIRNEFWLLQIIKKGY